MNHPAWRFALALVIVAAVASLSCLVTGRLLMPKTAAPSDSGNALSPHQWVHRELSLSAEQDRALDDTESRYARTRQALTEQIRQANHDLAQAMLTDGQYSPRMTAAVERIHHAQGELQKATLEHVFEMGRMLRPDQRERLLRLTAQALDPAPDASSPPPQH